MHPSVVAEETPKIQMKPPVEMNPLAKLGWQIRLNKYKPTPQEAEALGKCFEDARWYYMNGPLAAGALVWSFTGGTRLKAFPRVLMTASAAVIGHDVGGRIAAGSCMKKILSLEGSPLRGELIAILRQDFPNHPLLKSDLVEDKPIRTQSMSQPVYGTVDEMQDPSLPASHKDWAIRIDDTISSNLESSEEQESGNLRRISQIWKTEPREESTKVESGDADLVADPFELLMQGGYVDVSSDGVEDNGNGRLGKEHRRSRMSTKERREYDRKQYQRWQQEQQKVSV